MKKNDWLVVTFLKIHEMKQLSVLILDINIVSTWAIYYIFIPHNIESVRGFQNKVLGIFSENFVFLKLNQL